MALRAGDLTARMQDELTADEALQAGASQQRLQLLFERAVEGRDVGQSSLKTPVTRPRTWTCGG